MHLSPAVFWNGGGDCRAFGLRRSRARPLAWRGRIARWGRARSSSPSRLLLASPLRVEGFPMLLEVIGPGWAEDVDGLAVHLADATAVLDIRRQNDHIPFLHAVKLPLDDLVHVALNYNHDLLGFVAMRREERVGRHRQEAHQGPLARDDVAGRARDELGQGNVGVMDDPL